jgi:hypothetical protein
MITKDIVEDIRMQGASTTMRNLEFIDGGEISVKGKSEKIQVYIPQLIAAAVTDLELPLLVPSRKYLCLKARQILLKNLEQPNPQQPSLLIVGDAGFGKAVFCQHLFHQLSKRSHVPIFETGLVAAQASLCFQGIGLILAQLLDDTALLAPGPFHDKSVLGIGNSHVDGLMVCLSHSSRGGGLV